MLLCLLLRVKQTPVAAYSCDSEFCRIRYSMSFPKSELLYDLNCLHVLENPLQGGLSGFDANTVASVSAATSR